VTGSRELSELADLLAEAIAMVSEARPVALSTMVKVDRDAMLDLLNEIGERLPDELRQARWLLKEREEYLEAARGEAREIVAAAAVQAERMVERTEVVRAAEQRARRVRDQALAESRRLRRQTEDYCEERLGEFETTLHDIAAVVKRGRDRLAALPHTPPETPENAATDTGEAGEPGGEPLFDQDRPAADTIDIR